MTTKKWSDVYQKEFNGTWYPAESIIKFSARYLKRRVGIDKWNIKRNVSTVLDAGCGVGRHVVFFQEQGYETYGIDLSSSAIEIGNEWLKSKHLKPALKVGDVINIPFKNDCFDVVICHETLDHIHFEDAKRALNEIKRVCRPAGYIFVSLRSTEDSEFGRGEKVDKNTFILQEGYEKGLIQHYFDWYELSTLVKGLKVFEVELQETKFPTVYGVDKAYLQSSKGLKKYLDLTQQISMNLKYSRWNILIENVR